MKYSIQLFSNLRSGVLFFFGGGGVGKCGGATVSGRERKKKERLIQLLHVSSAASPESGLLSNWSKNKKLLVQMPDR